MNANALAQGRRFIARLVLISFAPFALDGCVSVGVRTTAHPDGSAVPPNGTFEGRIYETPSDAKKDVKSQREVTWKLFQLEQSRKIPLREGTGNVWTATELPPGQYRIAVSWGKNPEIAEHSSTGSGSKTFPLEAGETAQVRVFVKKFPTGTVVALGVLAVLAIVIATTVRIDVLGGGISFKSRSHVVGDPSSKRPAQTRDLEPQEEHN
jgi:hypothetical protein